MAGIFRNLRADEIECRVANVDKKHDPPEWITLLLYKDARCDMNILDETVGPYSWKREHSRENANCTVSLRDPSTGEWVSKEDTGTESNTEAAKGLASDSFKRACFNWGIGRELYTAPTIFIKAADGTKFDRYSVQEIAIDGGVITALSIRNDKSGKTVFAFGSPDAKSRRLADDRKRLEQAIEKAAKALGVPKADYGRDIKARADFDWNDAEALERIAEEVEAV